MKIQIVTREDCNYCDNAKVLLARKGLTFTEKIIGHDIQREEVLDLYPSRKILPIIIINDICIGGFSELQEWMSSHAVI